MITVIENPNSRLKGVLSIDLGGGCFDFFAVNPFSNRLKDLEGKLAKVLDVGKSHEKAIIASSALLLYAQWADTRYNWDIGVPKDDIYDLDGDALVTAATAAVTDLYSRAALAIGIFPPIVEKGKIERGCCITGAVFLMAGNSKKTG